MNDVKSYRKTLSNHLSNISSVEAKIFTTLFDLADPNTQTFSISLFGLSRKIGVHRNELLPQLDKLERQRLITITPGRNFFLDSTFKILPGIEQSQEQYRRPNHPRNHCGYLAKNGEKTCAPPLTVNGTENGERLTGAKNGNDIDKNTSRNNGNGNRSVKINFIRTVSADNDTETLTEGGKNKNSIAVDSELTANSIAKQLNDEKNLALYKAYLRRYPRSIILQAFQDVINTPLHRIKRSPGAYFTFLVKKYGGKR